MKKSYKIARGRKSQIETEVLRKLFLKYADACKNRNIKYNDPVFDAISKELDNQIRPYAIFKSLKRNYGEFFPIDNYAADISHSTPTSSMSPSCCSTASSTEHVLMEKHETVKTISFHMDEYDWKKIQPISINYRRRDENTFATHKKYRTLPRFKWATLLREKIWKFSRLPCTWNFKNRCVDKENNISIRGKCSQCGRIVILTSKSITHKIVSMSCDIISNETCEDVVHDPKKKSRLTSYKRRRLAKKLENKAAVVLHTELAANVINENNEASPPVLPSIEALRKIKHEKRRNKQFDAHPILSVLKMQQIAPFANFVRGMTLIPHFHLYYWSDDQIKYYDLYYSSVSKVTITVDATGSFFQAITLPDGSKLTKRLFLYVAMTTSETLKGTPIFQLISDSHSKDSITTWLKTWLGEQGNAPHEIITDDSSALIASNVSAFTTFKTVKDYIKRSFNILNGHNYELPEVFIRLDTSHFIKTIYNLRCFENTEANVKMLYVRCIIFIKNSECFETIKKVIADIIRICLTEYDSSETTRCQSAIKNLKSLIENGKYEEPIRYGKENIGENLDLDDDQNILYWFDEMIEMERKLTDQKPMLNSRQNIYYMPHMIATLKRLLLKLPLWSNIMCPLYKSQNKKPTSSALENYFRTMKHLLFETRLKKYRIDEYLKIHHDYLLGEIKLALTNLIYHKNIKEKVVKRTRKRKIPFKTNNQKLNLKKQRRNLSKSFSNDSVFTEMPSYIENWRGQGIEIGNNRTPVMFLENGNLTKFQYENISITNTCALDSVFFLLALGYKENINVRNIFDNNNNLIGKNKNIVNYVKKLSSCNTNFDVANELRIKIAAEYFANQNYSCDCNVSFIFENIVNDLIFSARSISKCSKEICSSSNTKERKHIFLPINLNIINIFTINALEDAIIINDFENRNCRNCNESVEVIYLISNIVSFDLNGTEKFLLNDIPQGIVIKHKLFKLVGATEFIPPILGNMGHYKSHYVRNNHFFYCYDDNRKMFHESTNKAIFIHSLTYGFEKENIEGAL